MVLWQYLPYIALELPILLLAVSLLKTCQIQKQSAWIIAISYLTVPIATAGTGIGGALYVCDFILPVLVISRLIRGKDLIRGISNFPPLWWLFFSCVVFPCLFGFMLTLFGKYQFSKGDALYFYRQVSYLFVFSTCFNSQNAINPDLRILRLNVLLVVVLGLLGLVAYFGPWDWDIYDSIMGGQSWLGDSRVGGGFLGLFRGSIGHWFALGAAVSLGLLFSPTRRKYFTGFTGLFICGVIVLCSFSRAGAIGLFVGIAASIAFLCKTNRLAMWGGFIGVVAVVLLAYQLGFGQMDERVESRFVLFGNNAVIPDDDGVLERAEGWRLSLSYFAQNPIHILTGIGPASDERIFNITGTFGAHNEFIQLVFKGGIASLACYLVFLGGALKRLAVARQTDDRERHYLASVALVLMCVNAAIAFPQSAFVGGHATHTVLLFNHALLGSFMGMGLKTTHVQSAVRDQAIQVG